MAQISTCARLAEKIEDSSCSPAFSVSITGHAPGRSGLGL